MNHCELIHSDQKSGIDASLFAALGCNNNQELPLAYYRYKLFSEKSIKNRGGGYLDSLEFNDNKKIKTWFCADPVHLAVGLNDITLTQQITDLSGDDIRQCIQALNQHFEQDGYQFVAGTKHQWHLLMHSELMIETTPLNEVIGKNIAPFLPVSNNLNWKAIQNEVEMILHALPMNQAREAKGLPTLNSLWFYGAGKSRIDEKDTISHVYGGAENNGEIIAYAAGSQYQQLPDDAATLLNEQAEKVFLILDQLVDPASYDDVETYQSQLTFIDKYLEPLIKAWDSGKIKLIIDDCNGNLIQPIKCPVWKFWAKRSTFPSHILDSGHKELT